LQIANFLAHFLLPFQREFSTLEVLPNPCPHLFLQRVEHGKKVSDEMVKFARPVTWIKCGSKSRIRVFKSPGTFEEQTLCHEKYVGKMIDDFLGLSKSVVECRPDAEIREAPWALVSMHLIQNVPGEMRGMMCEQQLNWVVRCAKSVIAIVRERINSGTMRFGESLEKELEEMLKLAGSGDWDIVMGLTQLFDKDPVYLMFGRSKK
jgi:hypothetical protein